VGAGHPNTFQITPGEPAIRQRLNPLATDKNPLRGCVARVSGVPACSQAVQRLACEAPALPHPYLKGIGPNPQTPFPTPRHRPQPPGKGASDAGACRVCCAPRRTGVLTERLPASTKDSAPNDARSAAAMRLAPSARHHRPRHPPGARRRSGCTRPRPTPPHDCGTPGTRRGAIFGPGTLSARGRHSDHPRLPIAHLPSHIAHPTSHIGAYSWYNGRQP
jgi:hypothetical protein